MLSYRTHRERRGKLCALRRYRPALRYVAKGRAYTRARAHTHIIYSMLLSIQYIPSRFQFIASLSGALLHIIIYNSSMVSSWRDTLSPVKTYVRCRPFLCVSLLYDIRITRKTINNKNGYIVINNRINITLLRIYVTRC